MESRISKMEFPWPFLYSECHSSFLPIRTPFFFYGYSSSQFSTTSGNLSMIEPPSTTSRRSCAGKLVVRGRGRAAILDSGVHSRGASLRVTAVRDININIVSDTSTAEAAFGSGLPPFAPPTVSRYLIPLLFAEVWNFYVAGNMALELLGHIICERDILYYTLNDMTVCFQMADDELREIKIGNGALRETFSALQAELKEAQSERHSLQVPIENCVLNSEKTKRRDNCISIPIWTLNM